MQSHHAAAVILKIAHEVLDLHCNVVEETYSDWKEDIKTLCAKRQIPYDSYAVGSALDLALYQRKLASKTRWPK